MLRKEVEPLAHLEAKNDEELAAPPSPLVMWKMIEAMSAKIDRLTDENQALRQQLEESKNESFAAIMMQNATLYRQLEESRELIKQKNEGNRLLIEQKSEENRQLIKQQGAGIQQEVQKENNSYKSILDGLNSDLKAANEGQSSRLMALSKNVEDLDKNIMELVNKNSADSDDRLNRVTNAMDDVKKSLKETQMMLANLIIWANAFVKIYNVHYHGDGRDLVQREKLLWLSLHTKLSREEQHVAEKTRRDVHGMEQDREQRLTKEQWSLLTEKQGHDNSSLLQDEYGSQLLRRIKRQQPHRARDGRPAVTMPGPA